MRLARIAFLPVLCTACAIAPEPPAGPAPGEALSACMLAPSGSTRPSASAEPSGTDAFDLAPATDPASFAEPGWLLQGPPPPPPQQRRPPSGHWRQGAAALQGYFGAGFYDLSTDGGNKGELKDDSDTFPVIGGGAQWKLAGERMDFGIEGLISFSWQGNIAAFASTGGGTVVAVDVDLLIWDLYGGPFASVFLGDNCRIYASAGPLLRWAYYDQNGPTGFTSGDGSGFGAGYYARTGIEFGVGRGTMVGFGARWSDVTMDLSGGFGDLDMHGVEALLTVTQGF